MFSFLKKKGSYILYELCDFGTILTAFFALIIYLNQDHIGIYLFSLFQKYEQKEIKGIKKKKDERSWVH